MHVGYGSLLPAGGGVGAPVLEQLMLACNSLHGFVRLSAKSVTNVNTGPGRILFPLDGQGTSTFRVGYGICYLLLLFTSTLVQCSAVPSSSLDLHSRWCSSSLG